MQNEDKLKKILTLKSIIGYDEAAHTISCYPINKAECDKMVKKTDDSISSGQYTTMEDLEQETKKFQSII